MASGYFQRSGGPLVRLTPQGFVSEEGENLNLPSGYGGFQQGGGDINLADVIKGGGMNQGPQFDMSRPMDYMGRKVYMQPGGSAVDAEGRMVFEPLSAVQGRQAAESLSRQRAKEDLDMQLKQADLAAKQAGDWHIDSGSGMMINKRTGDIRQIPQQPGQQASKASEDERKAAGWVQQATNAYNNMLEAARANPEAIKPQVGAEIAGAIPFVGGALRNRLLSPERQRFEQGASSFSEAALRAATGAGVNKEEAAQKIAELTPKFGDSDAVIKQKTDSMGVYLDSLRQ